MDEIMESYVTLDTAKVTESVSWAKFGEKSLEKFRRQIVMEEVGRGEGEGAEVKDVPNILRVKYAGLDE